MDARNHRTESEVESSACLGCLLCTTIVTLYYSHNNMRNGTQHTEEIIKLQVHNYYSPAGDTRLFLHKSQSNNSESIVQDFPVIGSSDGQM